MSRTSTAKATATKTGRWALQDAKTRFSEVVRKAQSEGPQHVTVHGRDSVVVVSEEEYRRLKGEITGQDIIDAFAASPHKEIALEQPRHKGRARASRL
jgi:prevent-host-death family protein